MKYLAYPSQDSSKYEWEKGENYTKCTLTDVENGSMITQRCSKEIAQLVPILVSFSHLHKIRLIVDLDEDSGTKI